MNRHDATEAAGIVERMMVNLATCIPSRGRPGSDARVAIGTVRAKALVLLMNDAIGPPLDAAFDATYEAGATLPQIEGVRRQVALEAPTSLGAVMVTQAGINLCLATEGRIIADMTFISRQDVEQIKSFIAIPFADSEETAADAMDSMTFQALIGLHAAITNHLVTTALPLPRMIGYRFFEPLPTLVMAYRLYNDASRGDNVRNENKVVHPAFCPMTGLALSA
jgi:hypothetical protein